eukprot:bmy_09286T0
MGSQPSRGKALPSPSLSPCVQGQGPEPMQAERSKAKAVALASFPVGEQAELSLRLGEPLTIVSEWRLVDSAVGHLRQRVHLPQQPRGQNLPWVSSHLRPCLGGASCFLLPQV